MPTTETKPNASEVRSGKPAATVKWVSDLEYSEQYGIHRQTLANWRAKDRKAGRSSAPPGFPTYKYFGRCVRYRIDLADIGSAA